MGQRIREKNVFSVHGLRDRQQRPLNRDRRADSRQEGNGDRGARSSAGQGGRQKSVIGRMMMKLFLNESGALYVVKPSRREMELAAVWGSHGSEEQDLAMKIGQGLIEHRIHLGEKAYVPMLAPPDRESPGTSCLCVPLLAENSLIGLLYARFNHGLHDQNPGWGERVLEQKRRFAIAAAETLAHTLAPGAAAAH
jgi:hypothetical protein